MSKRKQNNEDVKFSPVTKQAKVDQKGFGMFDKLPDEMKELVFDYLRGRDLLNLASTSKTFNEHIGSNSRYMKNIVVKGVTNIDKSVNWSTVRKYENLRITSAIASNKLANVKNWIESANNSIKHVRFDTLLSTYSFELMKNFVNLESLVAESFARNDSNVVLNFPHLRELEIRTVNENIAAIQCSKLKRFKFSKVDAGSLKGFILKQTDLEALHLGYKHNLWLDISLSKATFRLTELSLTHQSGLYGYCSNHSRRNFELFIHQHRDTLKELRVTSIEMMNYFSDFENIKSVVIIKTNPKYAIDLDTCDVMEHVQKLTLKSICEYVGPDGYGEDTMTYFESLDTIESIFPNLEELSIQHASPESSNLFGGLKKLKKLTIMESLNISELQIPNVTTLELIRFDLKPLAMPFEFAGNHIRHLTVDREGEFDYWNQPLDWIVAFLEHEDTKLDFLEIIGVKLPSNFDEVYEANSHKVKQFIKRTIRSY